MLQFFTLRKLLGTISEPYLYWWARRFNGGLLFYACFRRKSTERHTIGNRIQLFQPILPK